MIELYMYMYMYVLTLCNIKHAPAMTTKLNIHCLPPLVQCALVWAARGGWY